MNPCTVISTIINRREIEPLLLKASRLMAFYEKAVGCEALVLDKTGLCVSISTPAKLAQICELCKSCNPGPQGDCEYPCIQLHREAQSKAHRGGVHVYTCEIGLSYWTSPIFAGGRFAGSCVAGQVLGLTRNEVINNFHARYGIPVEELSGMITEVPEKNHEELQAMARLLLLSAEKLSVNPRENTLSIRKKAQNRNIESSAMSEERDEKNTLFQEKERSLLAALRRGDKGKAIEILNEILGMVGETNNEDFDFMRLKSIEMAVILSREMGNENDNGEIYNRCFRRLTESVTVKELGENLRYMVEHLGGGIFSFRGKCHASALRKAERFIWENYSKKISLREIADASGLSAPYFSTIFKKEMGVNLSDYLNRLRVEKATGLLTDTGLPLNEIAGICGFEDQSWFSKVFKNCMGMSPGRFREQGI